MSWRLCQGRRTTAFDHHLRRPYRNTVVTAQRVRFVGGPKHGEFIVLGRPLPREIAVHEGPQPWKAITASGEVPDFTMVRVKHYRLERLVVDETGVPETVYFLKDWRYMTDSRCCQCPVVLKMREDWPPFWLVKAVP